MIRELSREDFEPFLRRARTLYDTEAFIGLNAWKVGGRLHFLSIDAGRGEPLGLVAGEGGDGSLRAPFSAPFASFYSSGRPSAGRLADALKELADMPRRLCLTLPPDIYNGGTASLAVAAASLLELKAVLDTNWHISLPWTLAGGDTAAARNKYNHAVREGLRYVPLDVRSDADVERAYRVIALNREARGYPLRMTLDQVLETRRIVPAAFAVVTAADGRDIAAAQVFWPRTDVAQVIYWGDDPSFSHLRPMNFLACELVRNLPRDTRVLDLGPASENGVPNGGLCDFKASLGAVPSLKPTFVL